MTLSEFYRGKKIFLTGHTGFKGSWLLQMLQLMGAVVEGYALAPDQEENLFDQMGGEQLCAASVLADIRDARKVEKEILEFQPDIIFHLAAQPLVRRSYEEPRLTFETNVNGTIHVLEAMRKLANPCAGVMITTDKVYENKETGRAFIETDKLGGHDPYSSSKAAMEIVIEGYRKSYFSPLNFEEHQKSVVAMRAGNVIGGGDYARDRIIPDIVRAIRSGAAVQLRSPSAIRPWQHVLEPLAGYLMVAQKMLSSKREQVLPAYNIGPDAGSVLKVEEVTKLFVRFFGAGSYEVHPDPANPHEAGILTLNNSAFCRDFNWKPVFTAPEAIRLTAEWYKNQTDSASQKMVEQIKSFFNRL